MSSTKIFKTYLKIRHCILYVLLLALSIKIFLKFIDSIKRGVRNFNVVEYSQKIANEAIKRQLDLQTLHLETKVLLIS
jgi:hypothetical protein